MEDDFVMTPMLAQLDPKEWRIIPQPITTNYLFDKDLVFHYDNEVKKGDLIETMSLQGSFYLMTKKMFLDLNICDESLGSWGFQGSETAIKVWLNKGKVLTNTSCFYGHYFRNKSTGEQRYTREQALIAQAKLKELFPREKLRWLVEKFNYPADWSPSCFKPKSMLQLK